jgi:Tol biopolymer transport system component
LKIRAIAAGFIILLACQGPVAAGVKKDLIVYSGTVTRNGTEYEAAIRSRANGKHKKVLYKRRDSVYHSISPDRKTLVIMHSDPETDRDRIDIVDVGSGRTRNLMRSVRTESPLWSPTSQEIAYSDYRRGEVHYRVRSVDGRSGPRRLVKNDRLPPRLNLEAWPKHGGRVFFQQMYIDTTNYTFRLTKVFSVRASGGKLKRLDKAKSFNASPSGDRIMTFEQGDKYFKVFLYDADTTDRQRILRYRPGTLNSVRWAGDGRSFVFLRDPNKGSDYFQLFSHTGQLLRTFGGGLSKRKRVYYSDPALSPDGALLTFHAFGPNADDETVHQGLYVRDLQKARTCRLVKDRDARGPDYFAPSGTYLIEMRPEMDSTVVLRRGTEFRRHHYGNQAYAPAFLGIDQPVRERHPCDGR